MALTDKYGRGTMRGMTAEFIQKQLTASYSEVRLGDATKQLTGGSQISPVLLLLTEISRYLALS